MKTPKGGAVRGREKYCGGCKKWKPLDAFLRVRRGWKVTGCFQCSRDRMARWSRTNNTMIGPDDIVEI